MALKLTAECVGRIVGVILQGISANYGMFLAARFLIGFGVAIAHGASPLLITELVHPQHRAIFTTIYNSMLELFFFSPTAIEKGLQNMCVSYRSR